MRRGLALPFPPWRGLRPCSAGRNRYRGGGVPYGWQVNHAGEVVRHLEQQAVVARIVQLRRAGMSQRGLWRL